MNIIVMRSITKQKVKRNKKRRRMKERGWGISG
jgi:hypothetical protein